MSKESTESYYKILGTTAKIGQGRIKEKYIKAVKQHPPETDPEGFEKVRKAYETLKDPVKRKQYDLQRKYGDNVEKLIEKALVTLEGGDTQKAEELLQKANMMSPDNVMVKASLMQLASVSGDIEKAETSFKEALLNTSDAEEAATLYSIKANVYFGNGYYDEAIDTLLEGKKMYQEYAQLFVIPLATIYLEMEQPDRALNVMENFDPEPSETLDEVYFFISWTHMILRAEKWSTLSKVKAKFKKYLKGVTVQENLDGLYDELMGEFEEFYADGLFREAEIFIDLVKMLSDNNDPKIRELQNETKKKAQFQKEMAKFERDEDAFPLLFIKAFEWFYEDILPPEELNAMTDSIPSFYLDELEQEKEAFAAGIMRLKKKYPFIYKSFKKQWDDLFEDLTKGFNRQMKRDLKKFK